MSFDWSIIFGWKYVDSCVSIYPSIFISYCCDKGLRVHELYKSKTMIWVFLYCGDMDVGYGSMASEHLGYVLYVGCNWRVVNEAGTTGLAVVGFRIIPGDNGPVVSLSRGILSLIFLLAFTQLKRVGYLMTRPRNIRYPIIRYPIFLGRVMGCIFKYLKMWVPTYLGT